jgi:predicted Zn-dependent protease
VALIRTELRLQHFDAAGEAVQALERVQPENAVVHELKGLVAIARHDPAKARAALQRALAIDPTYFAAAADLAQLALDEKHPELARQQMLDFQAKNKTSVPAMTMLASLADAAQAGGRPRAGWSRPRPSIRTPWGRAST